MLRFGPARAKARRITLIRAGNRCAYPGCQIALFDSSGTPMAEVANIEAISPGGPRYNANWAEQQPIADIENLIVLCPNHHRLVDSDPIKYSVDWLRKAKKDHESSMLSLSQPAPDLGSLTRRVTTFHDSLEVWRANSLNSGEQFWRQLFINNPHLLAQAVPNCIVQIGNDCFVGGKGLTNRGGKLVDFIYATKSTKNVVIVEIKTPAMPLLGAEYRSGIYSIAEHLSGSVVQVLTYRNQLLKDFHALRSSREAKEFETFDPICLVLAGNLEAEIRTASQRASFDLFRANAGVTIVTYDELFEKIQMLVDLFENDGSGSLSVQ